MNAPADRNIDANDVMAEIEDVIRAIPEINESWAALEHFEWLGRVEAILEHPAVNKQAEARALIREALGNKSKSTARSQLLILLKSAKSRLR